MTQIHMKAAVLKKLGNPLEIVENIEIPNLQDGQILVKIAFAGVCHSQLMEVRGKRGEDKHLPHLLGHEGSGRVIKISPTVTKVKIGDNVVLGWIKGQGAEVGSTVYKHEGNVINSGAVSTFNQYAVVSENRCFPLPDNIPLDVAVLFGCAFPTGAGIALNEIDVNEKSTVAILGLGGIGLSALIGTTIARAKTIIAIDTESSKLELAKNFGATYTINATTSNVIKEIESITEGKGVDFSIEAAGLTATIETAFKIINKKSGVCIFASHPPDGELIKIPPHELISGKTLKGSWGGGCNVDLDLPKFFNYYLEKKSQFEKIISHRYPLEDINQALDDLEKKKIVRAVIEIS